LAASEDNHVCGRAPSEVRAAPNRDGGWRRHQDHRISLTIDILQTDADLAITFTEVAPTHIDVAKKAQSVNRARRAYEYIKSRRFTLPISHADAGELDSKLAILKRRLEALGEKF
jgi:hypothetical protein